jgi:hypothetical protein
VITSSLGAISTQRVLNTIYKLASKYLTNNANNDSTIHHPNQKSNAKQAQACCNLPLLFVKSIHKDYSTQKRV